MTMANALFAVIQAKPGIGDTIWHLPFVRAIATAAPGGRVAFLAPATSMARDLLAHEPAVAEVIYFGHGGNELQRGLNLLRLARLLRGRRFRRIYILDRTTRPAVAARFARIPERIGIGLGMQRLWITNAGIDQKHFHDHPIDWLKALLATEGIALDSVAPSLAIPESCLSEIDARFGSLPRPWIVAGLGASHPSKDWPDYHWRALLQRLRETGNPSVFLIGGPKWQSRADDLRRNDPAVVNACDLPIMTAAALLRRANVFVGPDSGPLNLAAAAGTRAVGIFGLTPSLDYSPLIRVVRGQEGPTPLTSMEDIDPDRVFAAVVSDLANDRRSV